MRTATHAISTRPSGFGLLILAACLLFAPGARAGLTFELHIVRYNHGQAYKFFTPLYTNSTPPAAPMGTYFISSPFYSTLQPTNGSWRKIEVSTNGATTVDGTENPYPNFNSVMQQITNGTWTMVFTNNTTTNVYTFTVSAPNMTSNMLPATVITYPSDKALNAPNQPTFTWQGPTSWPINNNTYVYNYDFSFFQYASLPAAQNNWTIPASIPNGMNCAFQLQYITNNTTPVFVATTPLNTNSLHQAISGWVSTNAIETGDLVSFAVTNPPVASVTLTAHYTFDNGGNLGQDSGGNGYNLDFNGGDGVTSTNDAKVGNGAAYFDGNSFFSYNSTPTNVLNTLAGDFSLSFWIKTAQNDGNENGDAYAGDGIVAADVPGTAYDLVPAALDGGQIGFNTGGTYGDDTVNSTTDINDGNYHHVVITRNQTTGEKQIYIDGALNNSQLATMNPLSDPRLVAIGCQIDASQSDPNTAGTADYFHGLLDDLQIYSGILNSNQIADLYNNPGSGGGHKNVAHYSFDNSGNLGQDSSGNGNDMPGEGFWGPQHQFDADAKAGGGAVRFFGTDAISPNGQVLTNLNAVLAGSFSFSAWVKTTIKNGTDGNNAFFGAVIFWAYNDHKSTNDTIPLAITGSKAAFTTRNHLGHFNTLHSITSVNDGNYHLITVTRNQATGEKIIYVDGNFETSEIGTTEPLNGNNYFLSIGGTSYVIDGTGTNYSSYKGLLDDLQIYSGVLSGSDVIYLYNNPGSHVPDTSGQDFNPALNTTGMPWATSGYTSWFVESTNTYDGFSAAQSGSATNTQSSTLSVTVTGPGTITFFWSSIANDPNQGFDYEFYRDNDPVNFDLADLNGDSSWQSIQQTTGGPVNIPAGQHTLSWTVFANGDTDPTQAGFLDQVSYIPDTVPTITLNPFSQTNYPGYPVWLNANATSNPTATWQWYKVGYGAIIGATSSYFTPTNSGTASVVGSYYAVASTDAGSAITTTAAVSFVSATLPPDWSRAFKSPFQAQDASLVTRDYYYGAVLDMSNNIYTAAEFGGNMTIGSLNLESGSGGDAAAIVKQTSSGSPLWVATITNNGAGSAYAVCVAPAPGGGVYLLGNFNGTNWLGTNKLADAGGGDIFLARFDANGSNVWIKTVGGTNGDFTVINALASDPSGNVTFSGLFGSGLVSIGSTDYNLPGQEGVLAQFDQTGAVRWSQILPGELAQYLVYSAGRLYVSLNTTTTGGTNIIIGGVTNATDRSWGFACLNATNGQTIWTRGVGAQNGSSQGNPFATGQIDDAPRIAVSGTNVFITGVAYDTSATFGSFTVNFAQPRGQYFARYDTNGNAQLAKTYGSVTTTPIAAVADGNGNVYVSGDFDTDAFFGVDMLAAPNNRRPFVGSFSQAFLAKFDRNGNPLWARQAVSPATVNFLGIALASDGVWASGYCISTNTATGYTPTTFGTNIVFSDTQIVVSGGGGGFGSIFFTGFPGGVLAKINDNSAAALPVAILNPQGNGANFQFSFQSQSGFTHSVLYRTNLLLGNWQTYSNVIGDGTLKTIPVPFFIFGPSPQGFIRVSTQ